MAIFFDKKASKSDKKPYLRGMEKIIKNEEPNKIRQLQLFGSEIGMTPEIALFMTSELGQLWQKIPFEALADRIQRAAKKQNVAVPQYTGLDLKGGIAAQVLKSYYNGMSDKKLLQLISLNKSHRWFCFSNLSMTTEIKDKNLLWRWREFIGAYLDVDSLNVLQVKAWKGDLEHLHFRLSDATVYEVKIAYPTAVKLLWQSCEWVYELIPTLVKRLGMGSLKEQYRHYKDQVKRQRGYDKSRRKTHQQTQDRKRQLLYWLDKGLGILKPLVEAYQALYVSQALGRLVKLKPTQLKRLKTIEAVYEQQKEHFDQPESKIEQRIVSLQQPHIRPIVRGKEVKKVEFGPKVNMLRIGGINLIEKCAYDNFNEGTRFVNTCTIYQELTGTCQQIGADAIYATNKNRQFATKNDIATCFKFKGKLPADEDKKKEKIKAAQTIHTIRATHMEGSFGNEKEHYDLAKIRAKTIYTQQGSLFCSLLTANAMTLVSRQIKHRKKNKAQPPPKARAA
jgi:transposase, IS5 family